MANTTTRPEWLQRAIDSGIIDGSFSDRDPSFTRNPNLPIDPYSDPSYTVRDIDMGDPSYTNREGAINPNFGSFEDLPQYSKSNIDPEKNYTAYKSPETAEEWAKRQDYAAAEEAKKQNKNYNKGFLANAAEKIAQYSPEYVRQKIAEQSAQAQQRAMERGLAEGEPVTQSDTSNIGYTPESNNPLVNAAQYAAQNQGNNDDAGNNNNYGGNSDYKITNAPKPPKNPRTQYTGKTPIKDADGTWHYNSLEDFGKYVATPWENRPDPISGNGDEYDKKVDFKESLKNGKLVLVDKDKKTEW